MKLTRKSILRRVLRLRALRARRGGESHEGGDELPLRAELFSAEQMEQHGKALAASHSLGEERARDPLLDRLADNEAILLGACNLLTAAIEAERAITPAGEWLLDNFYLIEEQIRTARRHLPSGYSWQLPRLKRGVSAGLPRVYDIALETISHGDGRVDPESLSRFIVAYQTVTALTLGELWAIPIMLRLALIENLRRVGARIAADRADRDLADVWADQMILTAESDPKSLILVIADMARSNPPLSSSYVAELARRLQGQSPALALPLTWIQQRLSELGLTIEQLVQTENQHQAADQVSIANSIGSLRFLAVMDWREFVEDMSIADRTLREDPAGTYARMDFATRDHYRHVLEKIARRGALTEAEVARRAVDLARAAASGAGSNAARSAHVGYYLVGLGRDELERAAKVKLTLLDALRRLGARAPLQFYLGAIGALTLGSAAALGAKALGDGIDGALLALVAALALLGASQFAVTMVNWLATLLAVPTALPRLDFSRGIPPEARTLVVVPTMLTGLDQVELLVEALEVRFLANRDRHVHFGLLTDLADARAKTLPLDAALVTLAAQRIEELNQKYPNPQAGDSFFLFHRPRRWNAQERLWMGFERKRGKLGELNALLRGRGRERFERIVGRIDALGAVRYVITLDTDTQLPRDSAKEIVGTLAHPLNAAVYDAAKERVVEGYGILQPRVAASLEGSNRSRYAQLHGGEAGIDPYTRAVSDVYQDLFGEGSFIGKGIYDVDAFETALGGRFPDNRILSHDLLEGCYARSGLLSDVQLYEDYPRSYEADASRRHRWIRGDWQIASFMLPRVPGPEGRGLANPLSPLSRWKILDNLRRSLVPPALLALLLLSWLALPDPVFWTLVVAAVPLTPTLTALLLGLFRKPDDALLRQHLAALLQNAGRDLARAGFGLACLPFEAAYCLDAVVRTCVRIMVTRRRLLEWTASGELERELGAGLGATLRAMWIAPGTALAAILAVGYWRESALVPALVFAAAWFASPGIAWWISRPARPHETQLWPEQIAFLHKVARRTWAYFERFVGPEDHWLPPDNFQEQPSPTVAHRTSPTNMGLALLANLSAYDFGYVALGGLLARTDATLATMRELERYRGHFYNWYDTRTLKPLLPIYVSTVDSGNLAGSVLTLRAGLLALADEPVLRPRWLEGLADTFALLVDALESAPAPAVARCRETLRAARAERPPTLAAVRAWVERFAAEVVELDSGSGEAAASDARSWAEALSRQCRELRDELDEFAPWLAAAPALALAPELPVPGNPSLRELARLEFDAQAALQQQALAAQWPEQNAALAELGEQLAQGSRRAREAIATLERLAQEAGAFAQIEYGFLYDEMRQLMSIGYNLSERTRDPSYYDLLASEARLSLFVAIAQGQLPQESWFALGRLLTHMGGEPVLLSWSGSMFEYLMPLLVMPSFANTLLDHTARAAVRRQIEYGAQRGVPWGISESGYNTVDAAFNYQYRAFGVPGLGLKRGLGADLVIAPYASVLALMLAPEASCANLAALAALGALGSCGFYEALDYTPTRQHRGQAHTIVRSFMAHHQGMSLLALEYVLLERPMQRRFCSDPLFQSTLLLLQERVPKARAQFYSHPEVVDLRAPSEAAETPIRVFSNPDTPVPAVQLLSNGRYHVMVSNAGGGYSRWRDIAVTRWREDVSTDHWGMFCYLRELGSGTVWSSAFQPTCRKPTSFEAVFTEPRVDFRRSDADFDTHTEIVVSPEDDIELRRVRVTNRARVARTIEVTSYAEVVLAPAIADALHPAFGNLFVQTEIVSARQAIVCTRRPRSPHEHNPWMFHLMALHGAASSDEISYETDRMRFIGRGRTTADPQAMRAAGKLSGSEGSVLDPIVAIRRRITLEADQSVTLDLVTGVADSRDAVLALVEKYQDRRLADRVFEMAWTHSQVVLRQINVTEADAQLYGRLASSILYANPSLRAEAGVISKNRRGQPGLWGYSISGDLPIVLLQIKDSANIELVRQLVQAHAYWRLKGLVVDLVIWNEDRGGYRQMLHEQIMGLIAAGIEANVIDRPGGIFVRPAEQISNEDRILLQAVARAILSDSQGTLAEQVRRRPALEPTIARLAPTRARSVEASSEAAATPPLALFNGIGGFSADGREYVITTTPELVTPLPWINVLANPHFGCILSDSGSGYTWFDNAHEFRLTPWHNDPVSDGGGEAFYLRDEETGHYWSPAPLPRRGAGPYTCRHGFGYSVFEHGEDGISSELSVYVAPDAAVKFSVLTVRNDSGRARRLSATGYVEWVLGDLRSKSAMHVVTELDPNTGALLARNPYNPEFAEQTAFFDVDDATRTISGDRTEFLGRNGSAANPAALGRARLSGKVGAAMDPCAAIQIPFELGEGQSRRIIFRLGLGRGADDASDLVRRFRRAGTARTTLEAVRQQWQKTLGTIEVESPDPALDVLANGWLLYQTIACRLWGRSGFYQSGGAFGFRDQLQDAMALVHAEPKLVREHLLLCASRQFLEGDVQHWWHPPAGRGVRTHCSDDYLWLPLATCRYVLATGDSSVLAEPAQFLDGRSVSREEDSYYDLPLRAIESASLYQHCVRAVLHALQFGAHGLPLMGGGDWNDGMNNVGVRGKGESVWLGFFLYQVLEQFAGLARAHGDDAFAVRCEAEAATLRGNLEQHAWDGAWYRRAYFDDGTPLGSSTNSECQIDSIAQSWSVLSGAGDPERRRSAMDSLERRLVRRENALVQLLDPPFDRSELDPGYIRGYVPGVRENGGQYTHAAVWATMAFAALGDHARAWELFGLINPVHHGSSAAAIATYKVEPYVVAADVYAVAPHTGRGGWTWYTGSAGWMYRLIIESLLGINRVGAALHFAPCLPAAWPGFKACYRFGETEYRIELRQARDAAAGIKVTLDGVAQSGAAIALFDDRQEHRVEVVASTSPGHDIVGAT